MGKNVGGTKFCAPVWNFVETQYFASPAHAYSAIQINRI